MGEVKFSDLDIQKQEALEGVVASENVGLNEEELVIEKKLVRKIDFIIMPIILLVYLLNWIDRWVYLFQTNLQIWHLELQK